MALKAVLAACCRFVITLASKENKMNAIKSISAAAALLLLLSLAGLAQDKTTGAIKGKVRVEKGSPAGVAVILRQGEREVTRTTTDKKGEFVLAHIAAGVYGLTFRKPGLSVGSIESIEVNAGKTRTFHFHSFADHRDLLAFTRRGFFSLQ